MLSIQWPSTVLTVLELRRSINRENGIRPPDFLVANGNRALLPALRSLVISSNSNSSIFSVVRAFLMLIKRLSITNNLSRNLDDSVA